MNPASNEWSEWTYDPTTGAGERTRRGRNGEIITEYTPPANPPASAAPVYQQGNYQLPRSYSQYPTSTSFNYYQPSNYQYSDGSAILDQARHNSTSRSTFPITSPPLNPSSSQHESGYTYQPPVSRIQASFPTHQHQVAAYDDDDIYSAEDQPPSRTTHDRTSLFHNQPNQGNLPTETRAFQEVEFSSEVPSAYPSENENIRKSSINYSTLHPMPPTPSNDVAQDPYAEPIPQPRFDSSKSGSLEPEFASGYQDKEVGSQISYDSRTETSRPPPGSYLPVDISYHQPSTALGPNPIHQITQGIAGITGSGRSAFRDGADFKSLYQGRETEYASSQTKRLQERATSQVGSSDNSAYRRRDSDRENKYRHSEPEPSGNGLQKDRDAFTYGSFEGETPKLSQSTMPTPASMPSKASNQPKLNSSFRIFPSREFSKGRVFKVLWSEPAGNDINSTPSQETNPEASQISGSKFGENAYHSIRRFAVVKVRKGYCLCLPILTYGEQGTRKSGIQPNDHAIIYTSKKAPELLSKEKKLRKRAIRVVGLTDRDKLHPASRLNYGKVYTVEHNIKVCFIGKIHKDSEAAFSSDFKNTFDEEDELFTMAGASRDPE